MFLDELYSGTLVSFVWLFMDLLLPKAARMIGRWAEPTQESFDSSLSSNYYIFVRKPVSTHKLFTTIIYSYIYSHSHIQILV